MGVQFREEGGRGKTSRRVRGGKSARKKRLKMSKDGATNSFGEHGRKRKEENTKKDSNGCEKGER